MDWSKDTDGAYITYKSSDAIRTDGFNFSLGQNSACENITIVSHTLETSGLTIVSDSLVGDAVEVQVSGIGDLKITLTLSTGDTPSFYNRYKESSRSENFS